MAEACFSSQPPLGQAAWPYLAAGAAGRVIFMAAAAASNFALASCALFTAVSTSPAVLAACALAHEAVASSTALFAPAMSTPAGGCLDLPSAVARLVTVFIKAGKAAARVGHSAVMALTTAS